VNLIRPQNRRAVTLSVRFCSFCFARGNGRARLRRAVTFPQAIEFRFDRVSPYRFQRPPLFVAVLAIATIAALSGALSEGQAASTAARSGSSSFPICARICV
jgi:hypothetical protein